MKKKLYGFKLWELLLWNLSWRVFESSSEIKHDLKVYHDIIANLIWKGLTLPAYRLREWIARRRDSR